MNTTPSKESSTGIIYHKILTKKKWQTTTDVREKLVKLGFSQIEPKTVASKLKQLLNRELVERRPNKDGRLEYMRKDIFDEIENEKLTDSFVNLPKNDDLFTESKTAKSRIPHGQGKKLMVEFLQNNIGEQLSSKQIAEGAGIPFNSSISVKLNKLETDGYLKTERNPYGGKGLVYVPLQPIKNFAETSTAKKEQPVTSVNELELSLPVITNTKPDLINTFQQIIDQQAQVTQYKSALQQIAHILASVDIIEGA